MRLTIPCREILNFSQYILSMFFYNIVIKLEKSADNEPESNEYCNTVYQYRDLESNNFVGDIYFS